MDRDTAKTIYENGYMAAKKEKDFDPYGDFLTSNISMFFNNLVGMLEGDHTDKQIVDYLRNRFHREKL